MDSEEKDSHKKNMKNEGPIIKKPFEKPVFNKSESPPSRSEGTVFNSCTTIVVPKEDGIVSKQFGGNEKQRQEAASPSDSYDVSWDLWQYYEQSKTLRNEKYFEIFKNTKYNGKITINVDGTLPNQSKTKVVSQDRGRNCDVIGGFGDVVGSPMTLSSSTSSSSDSWGLSYYNDLLKSESKEKDSGFWKTKIKDYGKSRVVVNEVAPNVSKTKVVSHDKGQDCNTKVMCGNGNVIRSPIILGTSASSSTDTWDLSDYNYLEQVRKSKTKDYDKSLVDVSRTTPNQSNVKVVFREQDKDCNTNVINGYGNVDRSRANSSSSSDSWGLSEFRNLLKTELKDKNSGFWKGKTIYNEKNTAYFNGTPSNRSKTTVASHNQGLTNVTGGYKNGDKSIKIQNLDTFSSSSAECWGLSDYRDLLNTENTFSWKGKAKYNDKSSADLNRTPPNQSRTKVVSRDQGEYCDTNIRGGYKIGDRSPKLWKPYTSSSSSDECWGVSEYWDFLDTVEKHEYTSFLKTKTKENDNDTIDADETQRNQNETMVKSQDQGQDFDYNVMDGLHSSHTSSSRGDRNLKIREHNRAESGDLADYTDFSNTKAKDTDGGAKSMSDLELNHGLVDALEVARQMAIEAEREVEVQREISGDQNDHNVDSSQVPVEGNELEGKGIMGFGLNLSIYSDDTGHPLDAVTNPVSIVSAIRASAVPDLPAFPLKFEGARGWKGASVTSAFRLASPLQVHNRDKIDNSSKHRQNFLNFDLNDNVADVVSEKQVLCSGESLGEARLKLDLNRLSDD